MVQFIPVSWGLLVVHFPLLFQKSGAWARTRASVDQEVRNLVVSQEPDKLNFFSDGAPPVKELQKQNISFTASWT